MRMSAQSDAWRGGGGGGGVVVVVVVVEEVEVEVVEGRRKEFNHSKLGKESLQRQGQQDNHAPLQ